jgi:hypothetical protein
MNLRRHPLALALALPSLFLLGGCGDAETSGDPQTSTSSSIAEETSESDGGATNLSGEEAAAAATVREYLSAMAEKDWPAMCAAASRKTQLGVERASGLPCEQALAVIYDGDQFQNFGEATADLEPESVVVDGNRATVDLGLGDETFPLVKEDGEWKFDEE